MFIVQVGQGLGGATPPCQKRPSSRVYGTGFDAIELNTCPCEQIDVKRENRGKKGM